MPKQRLKEGFLVLALLLILSGCGGDQCIQEDIHYKFEHFMCDPSTGNDYVVFVNRDGHERVSLIDEPHRPLCMTTMQQSKAEVDAMRPKSDE